MALRHLADQGEGCVPVISESDKKMLLGVLRRIDIIRAYNKAVTERAQDQHHNEILNIRKLNQTGLTEVTLRPDSPIVGKRVKELRLGEDSLMVSVRRKGKLRIVRGETILHAGDQVTIFAEKPKAVILENYLNGATDSDIPEDSLVCNREIEIPTESSIDGKQIRDLSLPKDCHLITSMQNSFSTHYAQLALTSYGNHQRIFSKT
jgi:Trk K+ transport system NAD-binding subunit